MCGIAGIYLSDQVKTPSDAKLLEMIQTIIHRGPDAQKVWSAHGIGLAHARLSIIDLDSISDQPMLDPDTGNVIVFNGEVYNYIELKNELLLLGYSFRTKSDTEVILKAYTQWGVDCLNRFNGMWAFAIYNQKEKILFCARDRLGIKPFSYGITSNNALVFASEAKAITAHFSEFNQANMDFLLQFIEHDFFACYKETFYKNIFNLLPGHYFLSKHGEIPIQKRYWSWSPKIRETIPDDNTIISEFKDLLVDAIKLRFRSDVPVGSCLSGGMDSGTIVGLASELFDKRLHTFSCVFPNTPEFDETAYINCSVKKFNTIPTFVEPEPDNFIQSMYDSIYDHDGPTGGPSILSQRAVMELASKDVKVVLDGQGADELLGGYHGYFQFSLLTQARSWWNGKTFHSICGFISNVSKIKKRTSIKNAILARAMYRARFPTKFMTLNTADTQLSYFKEFEQDDLNTLLLEHVFTNLTNLLHYEDRNSMRFSIESRLPFLDYRLVEFVFSLPHEYKIRGSTTKWLLNGVAKDILPNEILNRKDKMGFTTPAHKWFLQSENFRFFEKYLNKDNILFSKIPETLRKSLFKSYKTLTQIQNVYPANGGDINALWRFFTANMWYESIKEADEI